MSEEQGTVSETNCQVPPQFTTSEQDVDVEDLVVFSGACQAMQVETPKKTVYFYTLVRRTVRCV